MNPDDLLVVATEAHDYPLTLDNLLHTPLACSPRACNRRWGPGTVRLPRAAAPNQPSSGRARLARRQARRHGRG